ncbi:UNKNOWN [Stylonychia lemnae]|uniref:Uncharacterized protein n=1 Tax=Stylonychia lemnae TaxID=5949 RepID=A0A078AEL7_STYLE|nr:UNKNOWN [Stylonychia lemnae]|eukprot:CDW80286.1 UNKNOWN [Stylonychia lemnae]
MDTSITALSLKFPEILAYFGWVLNKIKEFSQPKQGQNLKQTLKFIMLTKVKKGDGRLIDEAGIRMRGVNQAWNVILEQYQQLVKRYKRKIKDDDKKRQRQNGYREIIQSWGND